MAMETGANHERWAPMFLSLLRIVAALIFIEHGTQKFFGFPAARRMDIRPSFH